jgi:DNA processing protein
MWLALQLQERFGSAEAAWSVIDELEKDECLRRAEQEWEWIQAHGIRVWTQEDEDYPYRLRQCSDRPLLLYSKGNVHPSDGHIVSIVGTRRATERGKELTATLVRELHEKLENVTIVSGGAYGIDIAAHRAAIECGIPTIIIPAHGLDRIYPYQHRQDAIASLAHGGLLTEFPSGTEPLQGYFIQRNRIVAGLADAVVVVESRERGGSLVTARIAREYGRAVFAFPGRPIDAASCGCNDLIRLGKARLITCADDLIAAMDWKKRNDRPQAIQTQLIGLMENLNDTQQTLLNKLQTAEEGMHINLLVMETGLPYGEVASELTVLELEGLIRSLPGGIYRFVR